MHGVVLWRTGNHFQKENKNEKKLKSAIINIASRMQLTPHRVHAHTRHNKPLVLSERRWHWKLQYSHIFVRISTAQLAVINAHGKARRQRDDVRERMWSSNWNGCCNRVTATAYNANFMHESIASNAHIGQRFAFPCGCGRPMEDGASASTQNKNFSKIHSL